MFVSETTLRVRYGETDQMGYVYYGNYALYYEVGRVEGLRVLGTSYKELEDNGVMLPVLEVQSKYLKPARYDDLLTICTMVRELPATRIRFDYEIFNAAQQLLHTAAVTLVFIDKASGRPMRCPVSLTAAFAPYFT